MRYPETDLPDIRPDDGLKGDEMTDEQWYKVYAAALLTTAIVIASLWTFSRYFSA